MRLIGVIVCGVALAPCALAAQRSSAARAPWHGPAVRPADVVARMASKALSEPGDSANWGALSRSLSDLAVMGGADVEATFQAAHLADSLSRAGTVARTMPALSTPLARGRETAHAVLATVIRVEEPRVGLVAIAVLLSMLGMMRANRRRRGRGASRVRAPAARIGTARSLASGGVEVAEIARRTGLAQEAVRMALGIREPARAGRRGAP